MPDETLTVTETCPHCGAEVDISGLEPLTPLICPACENEFLAGRFLGEYELLDIMGRGGMGVVYRAVDRQLERPVALKLLRPEQAEPGVLSKLESEAAVTASINHPNVVKVFTTGTFNGRFYIAMELVDKGTLDDLIDLQGRVAEPQALEIAIQMAQGLRAANQHGLIHRDIKPGNILFSDAHTAKIVDFGLAIMEEASAGTGEIWGTPYYVSPERLEQKPEDFRGDMYSLGATIFHALAGRPPFEAEDATMVALKHLKSEAVSLQAFAPWVAGSTAFVINRTLLKDPAARYQSYDELIEHLEYAREEIASGKAQPASKKRVILETDEDRKRWGYLTTAMIVVVLLLGGGVGAFFMYGGGAGKKTISGPPETASVGAEGVQATQYQAARQLLIGGQASEAAKAFHALAVQKSTPEPLAQWCLLESGIASYAAGQAGEARNAFGELAARPYRDSENGAVGAFFDRAAALGSAAEPADPQALKNANPSSYEALLLLLGGLKDWDMGKLEEGVGLMRDFQGAEPHGNFAWIMDYRSLTGDDVSDYTDYEGAIALTRHAQTVTELQNAAKTLRKVKADLKRGGTLATKLEEAAQAAEGKLKEAAAKTEAEKKALATAKEKVNTLSRDGQLKEAVAFIDGLKFSSADLTREKPPLRRKVEWLEEFEKEHAAAHPGPLKGRDPKEVLAEATGAIAADLPPAEAAERKWHAGVYALLTGQKAESRRLLEEAATQPPWGDFLPMLIPSHHSSLTGAKPGPPGEVVSNLFTAPEPPFLPELTSTDIGLAPQEKAGGTSADEKTGVITMRCGGTDIWGKADAFRFLHRAWSGDGQVVAKIEAQERINDYCKAGLMFRDGLNPDAKMTCLFVTPAGGLQWSFRRETGATPTKKEISGWKVPVWLKLVRAGKNVSAFASHDGTNWQALGTEAVPLEETIEAGLAGSSHDPGKQMTLRATIAVFEK